ncbi:hypothetical protein QYE76_068799 [Lolium multiflorum]|uniref:Gag-pol polyprotein n=1 Tax=Lolium multiflorum TaxID=4521 RepID=A0AAD8SFZ9_LOLMU|nr:hypothetical protein QYE76_068799 [Lolium multiflorum]
MNLKLPGNLKHYDGTERPDTWIEDYYNAVTFAGGTPNIACRMLQLYLVGPARIWLATSRRIPSFAGSTEERFRETLRGHLQETCHNKRPAGMYPEEGRNIEEFPHPMVGMQKREDHPAVVPKECYALVVSPRIDGYDFSKCLMDGGASLNIMYLETLERMNLTKEQLKHSNTEFHGVVPGKKANSLGSITLPVAFGDVHNFRQEKITFEVVPFKSSYHVIFGRPTYHKFHARACYIYNKLKISGPKGATYQRTMQRCLKDQIGRNVHAYVDDIAVMTRKGSDLISDLTETFDNLRSRNLERQNSVIAAYRDEVDEIAKCFLGYEVKYVWRDDNTAADMLSKLGSGRKQIPPGIFLEHLRIPSVKGANPENPEVAVSPAREVMAIIPAWTQPFLDYLIDQKLPEDEVLARQIVRRARTYTIVDGQLYK